VRRAATSRGADWDALCALGLPLSAVGKRRVARTPESLARQISRAVGDPGVRPGIRSREVEALQALLLALCVHFPSFYERHVASDAAAAALVPAEPAGRVVKLHRIAVAALAEYL
jgi:hypothetical protein